MDARMLKRLWFTLDKSARYDSLSNRDMDEWSKELPSDFLLFKTCPWNSWAIEHEWMLLPLNIETAEELEVFIKIISSNVRKTNSR
jgi:hypothetical protein